MQRTMAIGVATVVVAAGVATAAAVMLATDDDPTETPSPTPIATRTPRPPATPRPSPTPTATATPAASPTATPAASPASPTPSPTPGATPAPTTPALRNAADVDCSAEPTFCSRTDLMVRSGGQFGAIQPGTPPSYAGLPSIDLTSSMQGSVLHARVDVRNNTSDTFVFARRQIVLDIYRNGVRINRFTTDGPGFEMTPGSSMFGNFQIPIATGDGTYEWRGKIWYFKK